MEKIINGKLDEEFYFINVELLEHFPGKLT